MIDTSLTVSLVSRALVKDLGSKIRTCNEISTKDGSNRLYTSTEYAKLGWHKVGGAKVFEETFYILNKLEAPVMLGRTAQGGNASSSNIKVIGLEAQSSGM